MEDMWRALDSAVAVINETIDTKKKKQGDSCDGTIQTINTPDIQIKKPTYYSSVYPSSHVT